MKASADLSMLNSNGEGIRYVIGGHQNKTRSDITLMQSANRSRAIPNIIITNYETPPPTSIRYMCIAVAYSACLARATLEIGLVKQLLLTCS